MKISSNTAERPVSLNCPRNKPDSSLPELSPSIVRPNLKASKRIFVNNFVLSQKLQRSEHEKSSEIKELNERFDQLMRGQQELKKRITKQEKIIQELSSNFTTPRIKIHDDPFPLNNSLGRIVNTGRYSKEAGFITFRPSENMNDKPKFPRDIFSRKRRLKIIN